MRPTVSEGIPEILILTHSWRALMKAALACNMIDGDKKNYTGLMTLG